MGAVEHEHANAGLGARAHREQQRPHVGVDPAADVLQIDDEDVEPFEHLGGRLAAIRVEGVDRDSELRVPPVPGLDHVVLLLAPEPMLRPEERSELPREARVQQRVRVGEGAIDRGLVHQEAEARAARERSGGIPERALQT